MKVAFRADGSSKMGLGHIMRLSALMRILEQAAECSFYSQNAEYFPLKDFVNPPKVFKLPEGSDLLSEAESMASMVPKDSIIVLDGYHFRTEYQTILRNAGFKLVCIDDIISYHFVADAVINHAGGLLPENYNVESYTNLFLGPQYALVNPVFYNKKSEVNRHRNSILISLGGADPTNETEKVLDTVLSAGYNEVKVLLGGANKNGQALVDRFEGHTGLTFHHNLSAAEVCDLMNLCSEAVLAPSTVCYEFMTVGGIVYLYQIADNQENIKKYFLSEKLAFAFEDINKKSEQEKESLLLKQKEVFDGLAPVRLQNIFSALI